PMEAVARACAEGVVTCPGCNATVRVRPVPRAIASALGGVTHLLGEDIGTVANPDARLPQPGEDVTANCPSCGARLPVEGKSQALRCAYCRSMVVLPAWVSKRLRGDSVPHTFYLVHDGDAPRAPLRAPIGWSAHLGLGDREGHVYAIGKDDDVCEGG